MSKKIDNKKINLKQFRRIYKKFVLVDMEDELPSVHCNKVKGCKKTCRYCRFNRDNALEYIYGCLEKRFEEI